MDDDMSLFSAFVVMSVVKHIDRAVIDIIGDLLKNRDVPYHQDFTYRSGYEDIVFTPLLAADFLLGISDIKRRILEIEERYEEAN